MANLIDITSNILSQNTISFETRDINLEQIPVPIKNAKFGILNFTAVNTEETSDEMDFLFVVDCSGSMSHLCSDGKSKMQHIIHTLKNMILFFHQHPNTKINITINAFDTQIYSIVSRTKITSDNINEIIYKVNKISPQGTTNIEYALQKTSEEITRLQTEFPNNIINHIFMTDGEATEGSKSIELLQTIVNPTITNAFIGFGIEHDASLLNGISSVGNSAYYFIDNLESAGLVYGEILHGIIYKLLTECEIIIQNGLVYNFKTNTWDNSLLIGDIVSEANKTYNIISSHPEQCKVNIKGRIGDLVILFPAILIESQDLSIQIFRQRTLQILFEANNLCNRKREFDNSPVNEPFGILMDNFEEEKKAFKIKLVNFLDEIKKYMVENDLENDKVLKNLCDDVYICYRTFGTKFGTMYCSARQTSQGAQRQYAASSIGITADLYHPNRTIRQTNGIQSFDSFDDDFQLPIIQHNMSDFADTPYLTPQATQVMREISTPTRYNYDNKDDYNDKLNIYTQEIH